MNEFTKEELELILYDLMRNENPWQCGETVINKIQSIMDSYDDKPISSWHCEKCGHVQ